MKEWNIRAVMNGGWVVSNSRNHDGRVGYGAIPEEHAFTSTSDLLAELPRLLKAEDSRATLTAYEASIPDA